MAERAREAQVRRGQTVPEDVAATPSVNSENQVSIAQTFDTPARSGETQDAAAIEGEIHETETSRGDPVDESIE